MLASRPHFLKYNGKSGLWLVVIVIAVSYLVITTLSDLLF